MNRDIIVIGASAGGVRALKRIAADLPNDLAAALFVVLHIGNGPSQLPAILNLQGPMQAVHAQDGEPIRHGRIYVAPPDRHLLVKEGHVHLSLGPKENRARPSIDALFRSAALTYGVRVIGVVLSGALDDGTLGLWEVKRRGGLTVVQDPQTADYADMPMNAIRNVTVDYRPPLSDLSRLLVSLCCGSSGEMGEPKVPDTKYEPTKLTCPDCQGPLERARHGEVTEFRCRVGHRYSLGAALDAHEDAEERAVWSAIEKLEEGADLSEEAGQTARAGAKRNFARELRELKDTATKRRRTRAEPG